MTKKKTDRFGSLHVRLPLDLIRRLNEWAAREDPTGRPGYGLRSHLVERLLSAYLDRVENDKQT